MSLFPSLTAPASLLSKASLTDPNDLPTSSAASDSGIAGPSFGQTLQAALGTVNDLQNNAGAMATSFATGKTSDIHSVMVASQKASIALDMTTEVRNKIVDAYQEVMRMTM